MLYLSLREGDYLMIGEDIRVMYEHIQNRDHIVLGIKAPKDAAVLRGKVYEEQMEARVCRQ